MSTEEGSKELGHRRRRQCDQLWRNLDTLANSKNSFSIFWGRNLQTTLTNILRKYKLFWLFWKSKYLKNNRAIWSHWSLGRKSSAVERKKKWTKNLARKIFGWKMVSPKWRSYYSDVQSRERENILDPCEQIGLGHGYLVFSHHSFYVKWQRHQLPTLLHEAHYPHSLFVAYPIENTT